MSKVPPCRKSLEQHIRRVNYQVAIWKRSHVPKPDVPVPNESHGWTLVDGKLEPLWFDGTAIPKELFNIQDKSCDSNDDDGDDEEEEKEQEEEEENDFLLNYDSDDDLC